MVGLSHSPITSSTPMPHHHISKDERVQIAALKRAGHTNGAIACALGVHRATIGRELSRNSTALGPLVSVYRPGAAHRVARGRRALANAHRKKLTETTLATAVEERVRRYWSPDQIAGRLRRERPRRTLSAETIYQWIYQERRDLIPFLRLAHKRRYRRRYGTRIRAQRRELAKKKWITERPPVVEERTRLGDWEGDTVLGIEKTVRLLTHTERKSGLVLARKLDTLRAATVRRAVVQSFAGIPKRKRQTVTYDNGVEFADHEMIERDSGLTIFFAHPYRSWERGTNENANGLLRQFFPKRTSFAILTPQKIGRAVRLLNTRPRKRLHYRTPLEVFRR